MGLRCFGSLKFGFWSKENSWKSKIPKVLGDKSICFFFRLPALFIKVYTAYSICKELTLCKLKYTIMTICKIYVSKYIDMSGWDNIHWAIDYRATSLLGYYPIVLLSSWVSFSRATIPQANVRLGCRTLRCCLFGLLSVPSAKCPLA